MSQAELQVAVADLERGSKHVVFELSEGWLRRTLEGTDATPVAPGQLDVTFSKNGNEVLVRGRMKVDLTMPCVVTLDPVSVPVDTEILLMLSPRTAAAEPERSGKRRGKAGAGVAAASRQGPSGGPAKAGRANSGGKDQSEPGLGRGPNKNETGHWEETPELSDEDAGRDTYEGHEIKLDGYVREFLILELPMFPRRSDLPTDGTVAIPPLPADSQPGGQAPLDPRLSPLAELKSRLEKMKKE